MVDESNNDPIVFDFNQEAEKNKPNISEVKAGDTIVFTGPVRMRKGHGLNEEAVGMTKKDMTVEVIDVVETGNGPQGYFVWVKYKNPDNPEEQVWSAVTGTNEADHGSAFAEIVD